MNYSIKHLTISVNQTAGNTLDVQNYLKVIKIFSGYTLKKLKASNFHSTKQRKNDKTKCTKFRLLKSQFIIKRVHVIKMLLSYLRSAKQAELAEIRETYLHFFIIF